MSSISQLLEQSTPSPLPSLPHTLQSGPFTGLTLPYESAEANAGHVTSALIDAHLVTHPHLDHISGIVMNTAGPPGTRPKKIAALPSTIDAFKTHIFNEIIWPNLSDENGGAGLVTYLRLVEGGSPALGDGEGKGYSEICDGLLVKGWAVSHGTFVEKQTRQGSTASVSTRFGSHDASVNTPRRDFSHSHQTPGTRRPSMLSSSLSFGALSNASPAPSGDSERVTACVVESSAYFIQDQATRREILVFGDVEPDSVSLYPRNSRIWREAAQKIVSGTLPAVFIECSYDNSQSNDRLFGHLKPSFLIEELTELSRQVVKARREARMGAPALEGRKRKRTDTMARETGRASSKPRGEEGLDGALSPKSTMTKLILDGAEPTPVASQPGTPHLATPTEALSLDGADDMPQQLSGLKVVVIHVKETLTDGPDRGSLILQQLLAHEEEAKLGCEFVVAKKGMTLEL